MWSALVPLKNEVYLCRTRYIHLWRACFTSSDMNIPRSLKD